MIVLCRVFVWRRVAAADVTTFQTFAQMHPHAADLEAILATVGAWAYLLDLADMRAVAHFEPSSFSISVIFSTRRSWRPPSKCAPNHARMILSFSSDDV